MTSMSRTASTSRSSSGPISSRAALAALREAAPRAGILLDFDGSLAEIVARPQLARPAEGAREAIAALVRRYRLVALISGRGNEELAGLLDVDGLHYVGLYGMEAAPDLVEAVASRVEHAAAAVPEAWVEYKVSSLAVHYRQAADHAAARAALLPLLAEVAASSGLAVLEGKMVIEVVPASRPLKGGAVERLIGERALEAVLFAGDDVADLDAFAALDRTSASLLTVKVAVRGAETPAALLAAADLEVDGPVGLVELLRQLA